MNIRFNQDRNLTYSVSYTPKVEGPHKVKVLFAGREIPKSPYTVMVEGHAGDPSKVTASGPGLQPVGNVINRPTFFDVFTKDAGRGVPEVVVLDPLVLEFFHYIRFIYKIIYKEYCTDLILFFFRKI